MFIYIKRRKQKLKKLKRNKELQGKLCSHDCIFG
jgi:hypothetical protein